MKAKSADVVVLETIMKALLEALYDYANDGDAGPGMPTLPNRDIKLRALVSMMRSYLK